MEALVYCQITFLWKLFMTLTALIWLFTRVGTLVNSKCTVVYKALIALLAFKRFLTRMEALVCWQIPFERKAFITLTALIWFLTRVDQQMPFQAASCPEYFWAERALTFFATEPAVVISVRWQATDFPLVYLTFAVIAMFYKRPEFQLREMLFTNGTWAMIPYLKVCGALPCRKGPVLTTTDLHIWAPKCQRLSHRQRKSSWQIICWAISWQLYLGSIA